MFMNYILAPLSSEIGEAGGYLVKNVLRSAPGAALKFFKQSPSLWSRIAIKKLNVIKKEIFQ